MIIANPIYDVVFKYLMEDTEIAKKLLSKIIGEEIINIVVEPQEFSSRSDKFEILILRLDFKATIKTREGKKKKVLIELQKGKNSADIMRFRRYLGDNYLREDRSGDKKIALPIITVYFLGFRLVHVPTSVMKVSREYIDLITNKPIEAKEEFVEKLTHDSYVIQIPRLKRKVRTELEGVLKVFDQSYNTDNNRKTLELSEQDIKDNELLKQVAERLRRAATEEKLLKQIEVEEEIENIIEKHIREKQQMAKERQEAVKQVIEKNQVISEKDKALLEKKRMRLEDKRIFIGER